MRDRIGEMLLKAGIISNADLERAKEYQRQHGGRISYALIHLDILSEDDLLEFFSREFGLPTVSLDEIDIDPRALKMIPAQTARKYRAVPYRLHDSTLQVAMSDPTDFRAIDDLKFRTNLVVNVSIAPDSQIRKALDKFYGTGVEAQEMLADFRTQFPDISEAEQADLDALDSAKAAEQAPVVKFVNLMLREAIARRASDIHIEPYENSLRVRFRIDGVLYEVLKPPLSLKNPVVSRVKIMSRLDIAERRLPQDGRIKLKLSKDREMDFRVSCLPTLFGEKVVLRLLDKSNLQLDMTKLGFEEKPLQVFKDSIHKPFGMILVTGPTGSGKTTTLYSALHELNSPEVNISTAEDPVEFNLQGINQVQVHEEIGLTFAAALRSFLRQDPDIIMVGEIRDLETAEIAIKAALTGHLVLSTLHTNDAAQTINRLINMGVEPFLVANSVNCIIAQRLARKLCVKCRKEIPPPAEALRDLGIKMEEIGTFPVYEARGCDECGNTGFKGRVALYEVMPIGEELKELILAGAPATALKREAIRLGMDTLRMAGLNKLREGITTINEVIRSTMAD
jgi:type IV pilus assembly protein PilB